MREQALQFQNVSFGYDESRQIFDDLSLEVASGEIVAIVGPSGCGKSTLLRLAAGLARPTKGSIHLTSPKVGFVFQQPALMPWRTVNANVAILCELAEVAQDLKQQRVANALTLVGLSDAGDLMPHQLSGGMEMRTSLARALTVEPDLFCMDEPFASLDEFTRERLSAELLTIQAQQQFAALLVTHSISEAVFTAHRVLVLSSHPSEIIGEFPVPFPEPRDPSLRYEPEFARLCGQISELLRR